MVSAAEATTHSEATERKRIVVAETLGYCWGVRRAVDLISTAANPEAPIAPIGDIIHNPQIVERLREQGVVGQASVNDALEKGFRRVAITAHGMGPHLSKEANSAGLELIDTTCPLVVKVQRLAEKLVRQGYFIVVYGDGWHPEVKSVIGWANTSKAVAAKKVEDLPWNAPRGQEGPGKATPPRKVALLSQTTKNIDELAPFAAKLQAMVIPNGGEFRFANTICEPTTERQNALKKLIEDDRCDLIFAIGGLKSSNTARLAEVGNLSGVTSYHIESPADIKPEWLEGRATVGITAGASTPDDVIEQVVQHLIDAGFDAPDGGIHPTDPDYVPAY